MNCTVNSKVSFGQIYMNSEAKKIVEQSIKGSSKKCEELAKLVRQQKSNTTDILLSEMKTSDKECSGCLFAKIKAGKSDGNFTIVENLSESNPLKFIKAACDFADFVSKIENYTKPVSERVNDILKNIPEFTK